MANGWSKVSGEEAPMARLRKNCAILGVHPSPFRPTSVQLKSEINGAFHCKRHQQRP